MDDRIQIKVRMVGNSSMWESMEPLPFTVPKRKLANVISFLSGLQTRHQQIVEIRWNYVGSLQGHYEKPS